MSRYIDADALLEEFKNRSVRARNWKENAILNSNEEATIRADATLAFLTEVKLTIEKAPTIEPKKGKWIPIKTRPLTNEERVEFAEYYGVEYCDTVSVFCFDCPMPEDGQEILITTKYGVETDICCIEDCAGSMNVNSLEGRGDWEGVIAWMPMPEPYRGDV